MARIPAKIVAVSVAALALSGCQSFPLTAWMFKKPAPTSTFQAAPELAGAQVLEEGRAQLRAGHVSAAIASFRVARFDPSTAADANNGLGVAYIRLGRHDLADRYFTAALALQPENERFAANLLRLRNDVMLARREHLAQQTQLARAERSRAEQRERAERAEQLVAETRARPVYHIATAEPVGEAPDMEIMEFAAADPKALTSVVVEDDANEQESPAATSGPRVIQIAE